MGSKQCEARGGCTGGVRGMAQDIISPYERSMPALKFRYIREGLEGIEGRVLEVGCGDGKHARSLEAVSDRLRLCGCDITLEVLSTAKNASKKTAFVGGDATRLPFKAERFDAVIFSDLLEHITNFREAIAEMWRILKKGGKLVCYIPVEGEAHSLFRIYFNLVGANIMQPMGHVNMFRKSDVVALLAPYFGNFSIRYSYHLFGQISSFILFYYLYYRGKTYEFFRDKSGHYRSSKRGERSFLDFAMRKLVLFSNKIAYYESSFLKRISFPAVGLHIICTKEVPEPDVDISS